MDSTIRKCILVSNHPNICYCDCRNFPLFNAFLILSSLHVLSCVCVFCILQPKSKQSDQARVRTAHDETDTD